MIEPISKSAVVSAAMLLLLAALAGYHVVSAQASPGTVDGGALPAPTGLAATNDGAGVRLL